MLKLQQTQKGVYSSFLRIPFHHLFILPSFPYGSPADSNECHLIIHEILFSFPRLEKQKQQADQLVEEWLKRAKLALEKGDEDAARAALERKNQQEETSNSLRAQLDTQVMV